MGDLFEKCVESHVKNDVGEEGHKDFWWVWVEKECELCCRIVNVRSEMMGNIWARSV